MQSREPEPNNESPDLTLSVVVPIFNEAATLTEIVARVAAVPIRKEILLVDDGSDDGSGQIADQLAADFSDDRDNSVIVLRHDRNRGKGASLKTGFLAAQGDIVIVQDADLEYDPNEFHRLIQPIVDGNADVVYGSRFLGQHHHQERNLRHFWYTQGNRFLTKLSNTFTGLDLTDMETCHKVFRKSALDQFAHQLTQQRFGIEPEITARVARLKLPIHEIAIKYDRRTYADGKKIGFFDGVRAIWCIVRYRFFH